MKDCIKLQKQKLKKDPFCYYQFHLNWLELWLVLEYIPVQGAKYSFADSIGRRRSSEDILVSNDVEDHFLTRRRHSDHWYILPGQINSYFYGPWKQKRVKLSFKRGNKWKTITNKNREKQKTVLIITSIFRSSPIHWQPLLSFGHLTW